MRSGIIGALGCAALLALSGCETHIHNDNPPARVEVEPRRGPAKVDVEVKPRMTADQRGHRRTSYRSSDVRRAGTISARTKHGFRSVAPGAGDGWTLRSRC